MVYCLAALEGVNKVDFKPVKVSKLILC